MGLFNSLMKGMGFESKEPDKKQMENKTDEKYSNFDNGLANSFTVGDFNAQQAQQNAQFPGLSTGMGNLIIYAPKDNGDIKILIECLRRKEACIVNLAQLRAADADKILQFLSGAVYALRGSIKRLQGDLFLMAPEGVNIMQGKK